MARRQKPLLAEVKHSSDITLLTRKFKNVYSVRDPAAFVNERSFDVLKNQLENAGYRLDRDVVGAPGAVLNVKAKSRASQLSDIIIEVDPKEHIKERLDDFVRLMRSHFAADEYLLTDEWVSDLRAGRL